MGFGKLLMMLQSLIGELLIRELGKIVQILQCILNKKLLQFLIIKYLAKRDTY